MKHLIFILASIILCLNITVQADVVVFVGETALTIVIHKHGLAGFGPDEFLGLGYWGFPKTFFGQDYLKIFRDRGHSVFYASVGPVSSNWDRACELYAQIKGTRVDYGQAHSSRHGHSRFGKDYTGKGFYPSWDGSRKIHLVGHSMGGNTIRMLEMLLQKGAPEEVSASGSAVSNLFKTSKQGGNTWIHSIFTIATPHDGSTLHPKMGGSLVKFIKDLVGVFAGVVGLVSNSPEWGYNLDLEQFGLVRKSGEGFWTYFDRVFSSPIFQPNFKDLASWDLSPQFCREFNAKTQLTYPSTYYFSAATVQTHACFGNQCPDIDIEPLMSVTAALIGKLDGLCDSGGFCFNNDWEPNDGLVPLRSSKSPRTGVSGYVDPLSWNSGSSSFTKGRWYTKTYNRDHTQIIGFRINPLVFNAADGLYSAIADTIDRIRLPAASEFGEAVQGEEVVQSDTGLIAGSVIGALLGVAILAVGVVTVRRMRHKKRMVTAFSSKSSSMTNSSSFSPRKFSKKQVDRASITLSAHLQSENPSFVLREKSQNSAAAASEIPMRLDA